MVYLRRGIWYVAGRLLVICLILGVLITAFYYAMNLSNIQIVLKDGMANRAKYVMGITEDRAELGKYFQSAYLETDPMITATEQSNSPYRDYNIRGIDHRLEMGFLWVWPWDNRTEVEISEKIPRIDGRVKGIKADEVLAAGGSVYPPEWKAASYRAQLIRENGQWKIREITEKQR